METGDGSLSPKTVPLYKKKRENCADRLVAKKERRLYNAYCIQSLFFY